MEVHVRCINAWKLFVLLLRLLLHKARRGGEAGQRAFHTRIGVFDRGDWLALLNDARRQSTSHKKGRIMESEAAKIRKQKIWSSKAS